jgi:DNA-binding transcriptional ArsR family regulator
VQDEPVEVTRMTEDERARYAGLSTVFKALAHPTRLFIVSKLEERPYCVCDITMLVGADTSTISKHLSVLKAAGLVTNEKEGTSVYYSLGCGCTDELLAAAEAVFRENLERFRRVVDGGPGSRPSERIK